MTAIDRAPQRRMALAAAAAFAVVASLLTGTVAQASSHAYGGIQVVDSEGDAVAGAEISTSFLNSTFWFDTDASGVSLFGEGDFDPQPLGGTAAVSVFASEISADAVGVEYFWTGTGSAVTTAFTIVDVTFDPASVELLVLQLPVDMPDASISGVATLSPELPIDEQGRFYRVTPIIVDVESRRTLGFAEPAADGSFSFTGVAPGEYLIHYDYFWLHSSAPAGYAPTWLNDQPTADTGTAVVVSTTDPIQLVDQALPEAGAFEAAIFRVTSTGEERLFFDDDRFVMSVYPTDSTATASNAILVPLSGDTGYGYMRPGEYRVALGQLRGDNAEGAAVFARSASDFVSFAPVGATSGNGVAPATLTVGETLELRIDLPGFGDVASANQFFGEITWLATQGVSTGYLDGTFRPLNSVNRDAMAAFLYRYAGEPDFTPPVTSPFTDVTPSTQFYKEITWLASTGISTGYPDNTFRPLAPVGRDAMAAFLYRFAEEPAFTPPGTSPFTDVPTVGQFYKEIAWLASTGVSTGYPDSTFRPVNSVARDAMAAFLFRYSGLIF